MVFSVALGVFFGVSLLEITHEARYKTWDYLKTTWREALEDAKKRQDEKNRPSPQVEPAARQ